MNRKMSDRVYALVCGALFGMIFWYIVIDSFLRSMP